MRLRRLALLVSFAVVVLVAISSGAAGAVPAGANLLRNPGAEAGAFSAQGWDAVTIPGWAIARGLPTVVRYGTRGFSAARDSGRDRPGQLFAGGAGGTAELVQTVSLRQPGGALEPTGTRYVASAWLGGDAHSKAWVSVSLLSSRGRALARRTVGPVSGKLALRSVAGALPAGAARASFTLVLATSLTNIDGPNAPLVGYNRAVADQVSFSLSTPALLPPHLVPPAAHIPRFDHVFLFYFENQDYRAMVGNRAAAPYFNSMLTHGSLLANLFAEEHPSDANYLALAGGSAFGIPLTDPLEINPRYTINAPNIGDLVNEAHETWKGYLQGANGPCDDTVHGYYWNDDLPFLYFADVRDQPVYCAGHVVPLQELDRDLASTATTPSLAWIGADDCTDMEGCGVAAGDRFLAAELGSVLASPAWQTQRSLAIITFDEDAYDHERPAQRVATLVLGSAGVREGYVSRRRYTHYSLLRTIEAALGLGELTRNDRYAVPVNDVFAGTSAGVSRGSDRARDRSSDRARARSGHHPTAFVVNSASDSVTPVDLVTRKAGHPIKVGARPVAVAVAAGVRAAFVANSGSDSVTPIDLDRRVAGPAIAVGADPEAIAVTPDGRTALVVSRGANAVTPIDVATRSAGTAIPVGIEPWKIAVMPDGRTAYVLDWGGRAVTPIDLTTRRAGAPIPVGEYPFAIALAPNGATAYIADYGSDTVTPIDTASDQAGPAIQVGEAPDALAVTPDGGTLEVVDGNSDTVTPIALQSGRSGAPIHVGYSPASVAISGPTAYVVNTISGTLTPLDIRTGRAGRPISVGSYSYPLDVAFVPGRADAVVLDTYSGKVTLVNTRTRRALRPIKVGSYPVAMAVVP